MKETLGSIISRKRKNAKLTQEELATKLSVTAQAVSKWETDNAYPDIEILLKLADIFNCSLDELMGRKTEFTKVVNEEERKDIDKMLLKIRIAVREENTKVNVNLPVSLIIACYEAGKGIPIVQEKLNGFNIDVAQIIDLIKAGVVGNLVEIESDEATVYITVE